MAAYFGVNGGRIAEIAAGAKFADVRPADIGRLPQPMDWHLHRAIVVAGGGDHASLDVLPQLMQLRDRLNSIIVDLENNTH